MIGLVGAKGSGKTVLMTVLVKQLREVVGHRFDADIRIATDNPDGMRGLSDYQANREDPLYSDRTLPAQTTTRSVESSRATPVVLRWRQETSRLVGGTALQSTMLSFVDTAGEDLNDLDTAFTLQYLSVCDALIVMLDPFALPGARCPAQPAGRRDPGRRRRAARRGDTHHRDAPDRAQRQEEEEDQPPGRDRLHQDRRVLPDAGPAEPDHGYRRRPCRRTTNADGQSVHEHMLALLHEWNAADIDTHMRLNYSDYRYFGVSALGAEPDYESYNVAAGGVQPHRVEDPVLWLLSKAGTVRSA